MSKYNLYSVYFKTGVCESIYASGMSVSYNGDLVFYRNNITNTIYARGEWTKATLKNTDEDGVD